MIASFSISSFSKLDMRFFKISNSNNSHYYNFHFISQKCVGVLFQAPQTFDQSIQQTVLFLPSLSGDFKIKLNNANIRLLDVLKVSQALVAEQMEFLGCLTFFVKTMIPEIFEFLEKLKSLIQKKETLIRESGQSLCNQLTFFCLFDFVRIINQFYKAFVAHVLQ